VTHADFSGGLFNVARGAVAVRDLARHRTVHVKAGHAYVTRRRGR
jgi:hypothetical protein